MSAVKLRKGVQVKVITGGGKGKTGEVLAVDSRHSKVLVSGINLRKKHRRAKDGASGGGVVAEECYIHSSNVVAI
jgi:large subunit ribosomal protein L24